MRRSLAALAVAALAAGPMEARAAGENTTVLRFSDLRGWAGDNHAEALRTFLTTCGMLKSSAWVRVCREAAKTVHPRDFFEENFVPVLMRDENPPLFTGYYEPELNASRTRSGRYAYPIYKAPSDLPTGHPWLTRQEIEQTGVLAGQGLELAWFADPVDVFFLQVQGSGRLRLTDGSTMRVGFAAKNGHRYRSVGREMARRGLLAENRLSAQAIRDWVRAHPAEGREILWHNPSFIFFREVRLPADAGPIGAMTKPVTPMRSVAVDPEFTPLGAPVWIEKTGKKPIARLMVAQDTGSAIKGAQRADIFYGSGAEAGKLAGRVRDGGRMVVLMPRAANRGG